MVKILIMSKTLLIPNEELDSYPLDKKISFIAKTSECVLENPEKNISQLNSLLRLLKDQNFIVIKLTAISFAEIFKHIVPLYEINQQEAEAKLKQMIKKDERKLFAYELELLSFYQKFLQIINELRQNFSLLKRTFSAKK